MESGTIGHGETEEEKKIRHEWGDFKSKVDGSPQEVKDRYFKLLEEERNKKIEEMKQNGREVPGVIRLEERKSLLNQAETAVSLGVDPKKMEKDFEKSGNPTKGSEPSDNFKPDDGKPL